jgi:AraC-like DNA-binding protein
MSSPHTTPANVTTSNSTGRDLGLERSCGGDNASSDWIRHVERGAGVEFLEAWFQGPAYHPHRHDTYAIGLTERGVQAFDYRGATQISLPGQVAVLHPDERHDGRAGTEAGFGYRLLYIEPALIFDAVRQFPGRGKPAALPFVRDPVVTNAKLASAIRAAFDDGDEPLAIDDLVMQLAVGLLEEDHSAARADLPRQLNLAMIERARQFLDAEKTRVVRSSELESLTGLSRYDLARQFRSVTGTSPYRYLLMRRLDFARTLIASDRALVDVALESGFADQAHFTRAFAAAYGMTPARYGALNSPVL